MTSVATPSGPILQCIGMVRIENSKVYLLPRAKSDDSSVSGTEAVAVGVCSPAPRRLHPARTGPRPLHRQGVSLDSMLAGLFGWATGCRKKVSMHMGDISVGACRRLRLSQGA